MKKQSGAVMRFLKQLFIGGLIGAVAGGLIGFGSGYFELDKNGLSFSQESVIAILTSALFSLAGFINAIYAKSFDDISIVPTFVLTPLTYLGGVFYSISMLSPFWQKVSLLNPVLYMVNGFRYGILGIADMSIGVSYAVLLVFIMALTAFSLYLLNKGVGIRS